MRVMFSASLVASTILCLSAQAQAQQPVARDDDSAAESAPDEARQEENITVIGVRPERPRSVVAGSRIATSGTGIEFQAIATRTGVAGLTPGSGMDPFAGFTRTTRTASCRSDDQRISAPVACRLVPIQRLLADRSYEEARIELDRLLSNETLTPDERYVVARLQYQVADWLDDSRDREIALEYLVGSETATPAVERRRAAGVLLRMKDARGEQVPQELRRLATARD